MKNLILLVYSTLFLIVSLSSLHGQNLSDVPDFDDIFVVSAIDGVIEVSSDRAKIHIIPSDVTPPGNVESLKEVWKQCYGAMLLGQRDKLNSFFIKGVPSNLQTLEKHNGQVRILMISQLKKTIRLILKFELITAPNELNIIYDAHVWRMNEKGKWEVESAIYQ